MVDYGGLAPIPYQNAWLSRTKSLNPQFAPTHRTMAASHGKVFLFTSESVNEGHPGKP